MVGIILSFIFGFVILYVIGFLIKLKNDKKLLLSLFKRNNVIVYGKKGSGKDLVFNFVINNRKRPCASNLQFNSDYCKIKKIDNYLLHGLDYDKLIKGDFDYLDNSNFKENEDYYISDSGIYLPSQYHQLLERDYKSFPITYALSRHIGEFNIHCNTQNLMRVWDKLREQADSYICVKRTYKVFNLLITKMIYYDKYESAKQNLLPFKCGLMANKQEKALLKQYDSTNGMIKTLFICQKTKDIHYDTRAFHKILFGFIPKSYKFNRNNFKNLIKGVKYEKKFLKNFRKNKK